MLSRESSVVFPVSATIACTAVPVPAGPRNAIACVPGTTIPFHGVLPTTAPSSTTSTFFPFFSTTLGVPAAIALSTGAFSSSSVTVGLVPETMDTFCDASGNPSFLARNVRSPTSTRASAMEPLPSGRSSTKTSASGSLISTATTTVSGISVATSSSFRAGLRLEILRVGELLLQERDGDGVSTEELVAHGDVAEHARLLRELVGRLELDERGVVLLVVEEQDRVVEVRAGVGREAFGESLRLRRRCLGGCGDGDGCARQEQRARDDS